MNSDKCDVKAVASGKIMDVGHTVRPQLAISML